jgi:hypothetical protein
VGVNVGVLEGVDEGMKYVALGVGVGPSVGVRVKVKVAKMIVGTGRVGVMKIGFSVKTISTVGVRVGWFLTVLPIQAMINPSR